MNFGMPHLFSPYDSNVPFTVFIGVSAITDCFHNINYTPYQEAWLDKVCSTLGQEIVESDISLTFLFKSIDKYGRMFSKKRKTYKAAN